MRSQIAIVFLVVLTLPLMAFAQPVTVTTQGGLVSISCTNAALSDVFAQVEQQLGVELILEDSVKGKRLSAELVDVPLQMAVNRLLEGAGVNYIVLMDPQNWGRVSKIFVGGGGGGSNRPAPPRRGPAPPPPEPMEDDYDDFNDPAMDDFGDDPGIDDPMDEFANDDGMNNPPGSGPVPSYMPPAPTFPRSNFTPGLPGNQQNPGVGAQPNQATPSAPPPATFPFTDPFGRPVPIPPGMNQQQPNPPEEPRDQ